MTPEPEAHLLEEAIYDVLVGLSSADTNAHLAMCGRCRGELKALRSELQVFNETTLAWCKARPAKCLCVPPKWHVRQAIFAPVGWALAAAALVMIGMSSWIHDRSPLDSASMVATTPELSEEQIAQDNDLLRSVNLALSANEESPLSEYHLPRSSHLHRKSDRSQ
jgi:hypothetical protein